MSSLTSILGKMFRNKQVVSKVLNWNTCRINIPSKCYTTKQVKPSTEAKFVRIRNGLDTIPTFKTYRVLRTDDVKTKVLVDNKLVEVKKKGIVKTQQTHQATDGFTGIRVMKYVNGNVYEGAFVKGRLHGEGKMRYAKGNTYVGQWYRGKRHGYGVFTLKDGKVYEGEWVRDEQEGPVTVRFTSGDVLKCTCVESKLEGHGTLKYANGDYFEGLFSKGMKNGGGVLTRRDGTKLVGIWKNGKYRPMPTTDNDEV